MEKTLDAVIEQINLARQLDFDEGGFSDQISLNESDIWFGDPKVLPEQAYPFMFVEPVSTVKTSENTQFITRHETIRVGLVVDPRDFFNAAAITEVSATREQVRTMDNIERWFEKTTLRMPNGLVPNSKGLEVGTTTYASQLRGTLAASGAQLLLEVDVQYPRQR